MGQINGIGILSLSKRSIEKSINEIAGAIAGDLNPKVFEVNSESEMLLLEAKIGDVAIRNDIHEEFTLKTLPASNIQNWKSTLAEEGIYKKIQLDASDNQVIIPINENIINQHLTEFFINGVKQYHGSDFSIDGVNINYLNTQIPLEDGDKIEIGYYI